ncbi:MAG: hypothetical protein ACK516_08170, partial [Cyanobium sp.]
MAHPFLARLGRPLAGLAAAAGLGSAGLLGLSAAGPGRLVQPAAAQGTPSVMEFRWDNNRDYRKLYFYITNTQRLRRAEYFLLLKPRDRKTAI